MRSDKEIYLHHRESPQGDQVCPHTHGLSIPGAFHCGGTHAQPWVPPPHSKLGEALAHMASQVPMPTLDEMGQELGITRERVRQILNGRRILNDHSPSF